MINTGAFTEFEVSVDNHSVSVLEADGTLTVPYAVDRIPIHVAQRYSFVLDANQTTSTNYWLRANMITSCFTGTNPVLDSSLKAIISYSGNETIIPSPDSMDWASTISVSCHDLNETDLIPMIYSPPPPADTVYRVDFSFNIGAYALDRALVNGTSWSPLTNTTTLIQATDGMNSAHSSSWELDGTVGAFDDGQFVLGVGSKGIETVDIVLYSLDEGSHPFHLHGHIFVSPTCSLILMDCFEISANWGFYH